MTFEELLGPNAQLIVYAGTVPKDVKTHLFADALGLVHIHLPKGWASGEKHTHRSVVLASGKPSFMRIYGSDGTAYIQQVVGDGGLTVIDNFLHLGDTFQLDLQIYNAEYEKNRPRTIPSLNTKAEWNI